MKILKIIIATAILASSPSASAKPRDMRKILEKLDLTTEQKEKIQAIHNLDKSKHQTQREAFIEAKDAFHSELDRNEATEAKLKELHEAIISTKADEMRSRFEKMIKIRKILTDEQRKEFQKHMKKERSHKHRGRRD